MSKGIFKIRREQSLKLKAEAEAYYQRRKKCRQLLFGKGDGKSKNLNPEERKFVHSVWKQAYEHYLIEFTTGKRPRMYAPAAIRYRRVNLNRPHPTSPTIHRRQWYGSQKARWIRHDVPEMIRERMKLGGDTELP